MSNKSDDGIRANALRRARGHRLPYVHRAGRAVAIVTRCELDARTQAVTGDVAVGWFQSAGAARAIAERLPDTYAVAPHLSPREAIDVTVRAAHGIALGVTDTQ